MNIFNLAKNYLDKKVLVSYLRIEKKIINLRKTKDMILAYMDDGQILNFELLKDPKTGNFLDEELKKRFIDKK